MSPSMGGQFTFRGVQYNISLKTQKNQMTVSVEDRLLGDRWKSSFSSEYIEDLTKKTGNFKQFAVFASMLESALRKNSDSVSLDLLTFADLQDLRSRKAGGGAKTKNATKQQENKKYLILIYSVEFDRIHYPLPLPFLGKPDVVQLQNMVHQLNEELSVLRSEGPSVSHSDTTAINQLKENYKELVQEKKDLLTSYNLLVKESKIGSQGSKEVRLLKKVIQNLELEMLKQKNKWQRQLAKKTTDCKRLESEVKELSAKERSLQIRVKSLTNELNMYKRSHTPRPSYGQTSRMSVSRNYDRSNSRTSVRSKKSSTSFRDRSSSRGSQSGSYSEYARNRSTSSTTRRPLSNNRFNSQQERPKSRTPTPNGFRRFNPTQYNEERKKKLRESQDRRQRRIANRFLDNSTESNRGRSRYRSSHQPPPLPSRNSRGRNSSIESRNSSDRGGSYTRQKTKRSTPKWNRENDGTDTSTDLLLHRTHSSPKPASRKSNYNEKKDRRKMHDTDIEEIDARLDALQQYMREIDTR